MERATITQWNESQLSAEVLPAPSLKCARSSPGCSIMIKQFRRHLVHCDRRRFGWPAKAGHQRAALRAARFSSSVWWPRHLAAAARLARVV